MLTPSIHTVCDGQLALTQSSMLVSQSLPEKPTTHAQVYSRDGDVVEHVAPFLHGEKEQASYAVSHVFPIHSSVQAQENSLMPSVHDPPFLHGFEKHSLMFVSQLTSVNEKNWII